MLRALYICVVAVASLALVSCDALRHIGPEGTEREDMEGRLDVPRGLALDWCWCMDRKEPENPQPPRFWGPIPTEAGLPSSIIRFRMLQPSDASVSCASG